MTAARRSHEDESNHPSQIGAPGRSAGGADRAASVFHPSNGEAYGNQSPVNSERFNRRVGPPFGAPVGTPRRDGGSQPAVPAPVRNLSGRSCRGDLGRSLPCRDENLGASRSSCRASTNAARSPKHAGETLSVGAGGSGAVALGGVVRRLSAPPGAGRGRGADRADLRDMVNAGRRLSLNPP